MFTSKKVTNIITKKISTVCNGNKMEREMTKEEEQAFDEAMNEFDKTFESFDKAMEKMDKVINSSTD